MKQQAVFMRGNLGGETVRSVERALNILQAFTAGQGEFTLSELARELRLSLSTMHRLLGTLELHGFVEQDETTGKYRLGLMLFKLGALVQQRMDLRRQSELPLRRLSRRTGETAYLCVLDEGQALCLARVEGQHLVRVLAVDVGGRLSLNCGGAPRALLAFLPDEDIRRLMERGEFQRLTPHSLSEPDQIWQDVRLTRERGYTLSIEDVTEGVAAIGAPVWDYTGRVVGAISIAGILPRFSEAQQPELIEAVRAEAEAISLSLGWASTTQAHNEGRELTKTKEE